jgi:acyl-CoA reductase-like NAD-dependent aldehyde dehydrogenase
MARDNFIGGAWHPARSGATDEVIEPATGARLDAVAASDAADVDDAVAAAMAAFPAWSETTPRQRFETLSKVADAIEADMAKIQELEIRNVGKPRSIIDFEMDLTVDNWRFFAAGARFLEGRAAGEYMEGHTSFLRRDPIGVVGSIANVTKLAPVLRTFDQVAPPFAVLKMPARPAAA